MKRERRGSHGFIRTAAAAAVITALAMPAAWAEAYTTNSSITSSIPAEGAETPESVTVSGVTEAWDDGYVLPAVYLPEDGATVVIRAKGDITLKNQAPIDSDGDSGGIVIGSDSAVLAPKDVNPGSSARSGGEIDIESAGGVITIERTDVDPNSQVKWYRWGDYFLNRPAVVMFNRDGATDPMKFTVNGDKTASQVNITGGIHLTGANTTGLINATAAGSTVWGTMDVDGGADLTFNLEGKDTVYVGGIPISLIEPGKAYRGISVSDSLSDGSSTSHLTFNIGADAKAYTDVDVDKDGVATVTVDGEWIGGASNRSKAGMTVNINGLWSGVVFAGAQLDDVPSVTYINVNERGTWSAESPNSWFDLELTSVLNIKVFGDMVNDPENAGSVTGTTENLDSTLNLTIDGKAAGSILSEYTEYQEGRAPETNVTLGGFWSGSLYGDGGVMDVKVLKNARWTYTGSDAGYESLGRTLLENESSLTVKDDGVWEGAPKLKDASSLDVTVGETGTWTYVLNTTQAVFDNDEDFSFDDPISIGTASHTTTEVLDGSRIKVEDNGKWIEGLVLQDTGTTGSVTIGSTGLWQHPTDKSSDSMTEFELDNLAAVSGGASLTLTNDGSMTGFITADGKPEAGNTVTVSGTGAWDGGITVTGGASADVTIGAGGSFQNTILSSQETASVTDGTLTITNNGTWTGNAVASGSASTLTAAVGGVWNGNLSVTDGAVGSVTVKSGGTWNGNVKPGTGSASVTIGGTWNGGVEKTSESESAETEPSSETTAVHGLMLLAAAPVSDTASAVNLSFDGTDGVWNMPESEAVDSLNLGSGTVNFPAVTDPSSFTGSTLTVNGNYSGDGGTLVMNTVLEGDESATDKLVINGDASGKTYIKVNNVGGAGKQTDTGIKLVEVTGNSAGSFETAGTVRAGTYVYSMKQSGSDWYLTSLFSLPPEPEEPDTPSDITVHQVRPEAASYATNLYAANTLFSMKLSDRMGESAYTEALKDTNRNARGVWLRTEGGHTRHEMADGQTTTRGNWGLVQVGGDIASWPASGANRFHVGLMAGFAHESAKTGSSVVNYQSKGKISGYSAGIYGTWMNSNPTGTGPYVDTWLQYQRFKNTVTSSDYDVDETYHTKGFTASLEAGYTFGLKDWKSASGVDNATRLRLEGQVIRMGVRGGDHLEQSTGTLVAGTGAENVRTRVGLTAYHLFSNDAKGTAVKPYLTLNWFHDTKSFGSVMNGVKDTITGTRNFGELKVGLEGKLTKSVNLWGAAGYQQGSHGLRNVEAILGAKILF